MEVRGKLHSITRDAMTGAQYLALEIESIPEGIGSLQEKDLDIGLKIHREKRSLNANAYYWRLVEKIASLLGASRPFVHNMLLRDYGTLEQVAGENVQAWLPEDPETYVLALESDTYHYMPTSYSKLIDGKLWRQFFVIKGSSRYDTAEMSRLINGTVSEAEMMGIDTLPPEEMERMMRLYEEHYTDRS